MNIVFPFTQEVTRGRKDVKTGVRRGTSEIFTVKGKEIYSYDPIVIGILRKNEVSRYYDIKN